MRGAQILSLALAVLCGQSLAVPQGRKEVGGPERSIAVRGDLDDRVGGMWTRDDDEPGEAWKRDDDEPRPAWRRDGDEPGN